MWIPLKSDFFFRKSLKNLRTGIYQTLYFFFGTTRHRRKNNFPKKKFFTKSWVSPDWWREWKKIQFCCCVCRCCVRCNIVVLLNRQRRRLFVHRHDDEDDDYGARTLPTLTMIIIYLTRQPDESHYSATQSTTLETRVENIWIFIFFHSWKIQFSSSTTTDEEKKSFSSSHFHTHNFHSIP